MNPDPGTPAYALRPATDRDAAFIHELRRAGLREYVARIWGWDEAEQSARFAALFDPARYQVVVVAGQDVGALSVAWRDDEAFIADVEIAPDWRGRGLGTAIVDAVMAEAGQRGLPVALQVLHANPARRLYERLGFSVAGQTVTHILMRAAPAPLGLPGGIVRLAPHHPAWATLFAREAARIRAALGDQSRPIEHVGSTAVAGLIAKPIIDVLVGIADLDDADEATRALDTIGYERRPSGDVPGRLYFLRGPADDRAYSLSLAEPASDFWRNLMQFRDALRHDPELAAAYARLKRNLAAQYAEDRPAYTAGKEAFIAGALAAVGDSSGGTRDDERGMP